MDVKENIKSGLTFIGDTVSEVAASIAEKNRLRVQLNYIKSVIKSDTATRDQAYIELGRYFYENLREGASAENEAICAVIDSSSDRISKASLKYMELLNLQNATKIRSENAERLAKIISDKTAASVKAAKERGAASVEVAKEKGAEALDKAKGFAADLADKAKTAAADLADKAADTVEEVKERFDPERNVDLEELIAAEQAKLKEAEASAVSDSPEPPAPAAPETAAPATPVSTNEESPDSFSF